MNSPREVQSLLPIGKQAGHSKPCVLFIEDDPHLRNVVTSVLEYMDYEVTQCDSPSQAARAVSKREQVDLVISDVGACGDTVCESIADVCVHIPEAVVLFASGHSHERCCSSLECGQSCPIAFLSKPFSIQEFQDAIESLLRRRPVVSRCSKVPALLRKAPSSTSRATRPGLKCGKLDP